MTFSNRYSGMQENPFNPNFFALNGSFLVAVLENKTPSKIIKARQPDAFKNDSLSDYLKNQFPPKLTIPGLLHKIEIDHQNSPNLYLTKREVVLLPQEEPVKPIERVQCLKNLLSQLFSNQQVDTSARGFAQIAISTLTDWQKFILTHVLNHFHTLLLNPKYYNTKQLRTQFFSTIYSFFIPTSLQTIPVRISAPVDLISGKLQVSPPQDLCMIVKSPKDIMVLSPDTFSWPSVEFDDNSYVDCWNLHLKNVDTNEYIDLQFAPKQVKFTKEEKGQNLTIPKQYLISSTTWRQILWPDASPYRDSIRSVIESCIAFGSDPLNAAAATGIARVVTSIDNSFSLAFYATFKESSKDFEQVVTALLTLFMSEHREMQLLKLVSYYELHRTIDVNEIFRKNNNYIRTITFYIQMVSDEFKLNTVKPLFHKIVKAGKWSFDHPSEKDLQTVSKLIKESFIFLTDNINNIPASVRNLCRYLRLLSERKFQDPKLIHRSNFAIILLRYIIPLLIDPSGLGIDAESFAAGLVLVIHFTKILLSAGQNQILIDQHDSDRILWNPVIEENAPYVDKFYEVLSQEPKDQVLKESSHISKSQLIESATIIRDYVQRHAEALGAYVPPTRFENIFVDELLTEFASRSIQH